MVITTKNRKEELLKAVESAMGQRGLLEVIVIDDGSTDGTAEELEKKFNHRGHNRASGQMRDGAIANWPEGRGSGRDRVKEHGGLVCSEAGLPLDNPSGAAFSNPSTSELNRDPENTSLIRSADGPASLPATGYSPPVTTGLPVLRLIRHEVSAGYIVRRNEGARVARGDVIFSLDDDAVFSSPFVVEQTLRDFSHPRIGAVAIPFIEPHKANREMQRAPTREDVWITASYIGTAHAVRRDVFLALGGYREHLVHQGEEGDFCLRMLAAELKNEAGLTTEHTEGTEDEAVLTTIERQGGREKEQPKVGPKGEGVGTTESKDTESTEFFAGVSSDSRAGYAFSNLSTSKLARDSENTSLIRSADAPASLPSTSHSPLATPLEAAEPGFFVRLGNSDPIIHNESPKRDYSRMDFYGRRNDVLFHWQNTPMPDLLWQLPMTIAGGVVCAAKVGRWRKMLEGIGAGFLAIAGGVKREPVPRDIRQTFKLLKQRSRIARL